MPHKWTINDDIVALYLYLYGDSMLNKGIEEISYILGMSLSCLKMRISRPVIFFLLIIDILKHKYNFQY